LSSATMGSKKGDALGAGKKTAPRFSKILSRFCQADVGIAES